MRMKIELTGDPHKHLRKQPAYHLSPFELDELSSQLEFLREKGFIRPSTASWSAPVFFVLKRNRGARLVLDYRRLNNITVDDAHSMPLTRQLLDRLGAPNKIWSQLDIISCFNLLELDESSKELTSFATPMGQFEYNVVCMGLKNAPQHCARFFTEVLDGLDAHVAVFVDDLVLASATFDEHMLLLKSVLERFAKHNLYVNLIKSNFAVTRFEFLGSIFDADGRHADPAKCQALVDMPDPTSFKQLRSFLGLSGYFADFIPGYMDKTACLQRIKANKDKHLSFASVFNDQCRAACKVVRKALVSPPVLQLPDWDKPFVLVTDASKVALGSCLMQRSTDSAGNPILLPLAYRSRLLDKSRASSAARHLEFLAFNDALKFFRAYLIGRRFDVYSDHRPLEHFATQPKLSMAEAASLDFVSLFQYDWHYLPGPKMDLLPPDLLSRPFNRKIIPVSGADYVNADGSPRVNNDVFDHLDEFNIALSYITNACHHDSIWYSHPADISSIGSMSVPGLEISDFIRETRTDPFYSQVLGIINSNRHPVHKFHSQFLIGADGLLYNHQPLQDTLRVCVPTTLVQPLLHLYHSTKLGGHIGADGLYAKLRPNFSFSGNMHKTCRNFVKACRACAISKPNRHPDTQAALSIPAPILVPFSDLSTDFMEMPEAAHNGITYDFIQVFVCGLTGAIHGLPCSKTITGAESADLYYHKLFPFWGMPRVLRSDRDPRFTDAFYKQLQRLTGTDLAFTTANNPCSRAEKANETLQIALRCFATWSGDNWVRDLPAILFALHDSHRPSRDNVSPFQAIYGFTPFSPKLLVGNPITPGSADEAHSIRVTARQRAQDAIDLAADRLATKLPGRTAPQLKPGDLVHVDHRALRQPGDAERPKKKLAPLFSENVYRVLEVPHGQTVKLDLIDHPRAHNVINRVFIRKCDHPECNTDGIAAVEEQEVVFTVDAVLDSKTPSTNLHALWKRTWLVRWSQSKKTQWLKRDQFVSPAGVITQGLVKFERNRTNLFDTLNASWV
eukprot:m.373535 g.373535  ORF g.373535 m.373535 type:complete len:1017 (+) comp16690_c0_seq26:848-3898(+)